MRIARVRERGRHKWEGTESGWHRSSPYIFTEIWGADSLEGERCPIASDVHWRVNDGGCTEDDWGITHCYSQASTVVAVPCRNLDFAWLCNSETYWNCGMLENRHAPDLTFEEACHGPEATAMAFGCSIPGAPEVEWSLAMFLLALLLASLAASRAGRSRSSRSGAISSSSS
jgi:hypothetical protein